MKWSGDVQPKQCNGSINWFQQFHFNKTPIKYSNIIDYG